MTGKCNKKYAYLNIDWERERKPGAMHDFNILLTGEPITPTGVELNDQIKD